jgi:hypothetical protein
MESGSPRVCADPPKAIFNHLDPILSYNSVFYEKLRGAMEGESFDAATTLLGPMFSELAFLLKTYSMYINNFSLACKQIEKSSKKKPRFKEFLVTAKNDPRTLSKGIVDFLIMPVQRIPRYSLLLADLLRHTPADHVDHAGLETALAKINEVAHFINDAKAAQDDFVHVNDIQARLVDARYSLLRGKRKLIREEPVTLVRLDGLAEPSQEEMVMYFFSDCLLFATKSRKKIVVRHWIWLQELQPVDKDFMSFPAVSEFCVHLRGEMERLRERQKQEESLARLAEGELSFIVASLTVDGMMKLRVFVQKESTVASFLEQLAAKCGFDVGDCKVLFKNEPMDPQAVLADLDLATDAVVHVLPNSSTLFPSLQPIAKRAELVDDNLMVDFGTPTQSGSLHIEVVKEDYKLNPHSSKAEVLQVIFHIPSLSREEVEYFLGQLSERVAFCRDHVVNVWKLMNASEREPEAKGPSFLSTMFDSVRESAFAGLVSPGMQRKGTTSLGSEKKLSSPALRRPAADEISRSTERVPDVETRMVALIPITEYREDEEDPRAVLRAFASKAVPKPPSKRNSVLPPAPPAPPKPRATSMIELRSKASISDRINAEIEAAERAALETAASVERRVREAEEAAAEPRKAHEPVAVPKKPSVVLAKKNWSPKGSPKAVPQKVIAAKVEMEVCCNESQARGKFCYVCGKRIGDGASPGAVVQPRAVDAPVEPVVPDVGVKVQAVKKGVKKGAKFVKGAKWDNRSLSGPIPPKPLVVSEAKELAKPKEVAQPKEVVVQKDVAQPKEAAQPMRGGMSRDTLQQLGLLDDEAEPPAEAPKAAFKSAPPPPPGKRR